MQTIQRISAIALVLAITFSLFSCKSNETTKASSTGKPSEILIVAEDNLWASSLGDTIQNYFDTPRLGLPQPEPLYKVVQIKLDEFKRLFQTHRNVFVISIDSTIAEAKYETGYNVWAAPQRVIKITAPTIELLKQSFLEHQRDIYNLYENAEIERLQTLFSKSNNIKAMELIKKKFNLDMKIPADYYIAVDKDNFLWLRREANILSQGILIYSYAYTDTNAFNPLKILSVRNQFTRLYVPGPSDSSFMIVADAFVKPVSRTIQLKKELAIETRGLWEVEKDFMGGPFINYTMVDRRNNMVLALDGYVYAPNKDKADLLKQVQAVLLSFEFIAN
jgi:hypothetical protein